MDAQETETEWFRDLGEEPNTTGKKKSMK